MRELLLSPAVEEVGNVRVFFSLRHAIVFNFIHREHPGENVARDLRRKGDRQRISLVVNGETDKVCVRAIRCGEVCEAGNRDGAGDLARAVGAKVKENY